MTNVDPTAFLPPLPEKPSRVDLHGRAVKACYVRFRCPKCQFEAIEDAFDGAVFCEVKSEDPKKRHSRTQMEAMSIVRDVENEGFHPDSNARQAERRARAKTE